MKEITLEDLIEEIEEMGEDICLEYVVRSLKTIKDRHEAELKEEQ